MPLRFASDSGTRSSCPRKGGLISTAVTLPPETPTCTVRSFDPDRAAAEKPPETSRAPEIAPRAVALPRLLPENTPASPVSWPLTFMS